MEHVGAFSLLDVNGVETSKFNLTRVRSWT